ncbi:MAG TPA: HD domain-containing protein [Polyangiaceae bacterium]|nr:HD domain-containing protein [Polyangiaceae bacterium]
MDDDELSVLLYALEGVAQDKAYHPEGDALFHSLQVFEHARRSSDDRALWAAALFHDVGKAGGGRDHDVLGAELLGGLIAPRVVWLVRHHLDLLRAPGATRRRLRRYPAALADLERLRRWDVAGRDPRARVLSADEALSLALAEPELLLPGAALPSGAYPHDDDKEVWA